MSYLVAPSKIDLTSSVAVEQVRTDEVVEIFLGCRMPGGLGGGEAWNKKNFI